MTRGIPFPTEFLTPLLPSLDDRWGSTTLSGADVPDEVVVGRSTDGGTEYRFVYPDDEPDGGVKSLDGRPDPVTVVPGKFSGKVLAIRTFRLPPDALAARIRAAAATQPRVNQQLNYQLVGNILAAKAAELAVG